MAYIGGKKVGAYLDGMKVGAYLDGKKVLGGQELTNKYRLTIAAYGSGTFGFNETNGDLDPKYPPYSVRDTIIYLDSDTSAGRCRLAVEGQMEDLRPEKFTLSFEDQTVEPIILNHSASPGSGRYFAVGASYVTEYFAAHVGETIDVWLFPVE